MFVAALAFALAPEATSAEPRKGLQQLVQSCEAHKFETIVRTVVGGKVEASRVKICGVVGQSDADWVKTLKDAATKVVANGEMPKAEKDQISTALSLEISKVEGRIATGALSLPKASGLGTLPALNGNDRREYSALPPLPAPVAATAAAANLPKQPRLPPVRFRLGCILQTSLGREEECDEVGFGTTFVVHADEGLPSGASLRFVRDGEPQAELPLQPLARGKSTRIRFPNDLCSKVLRASVEVQVMRSPSRGEPQAVGTQGPYSLYCI